MAEKYNTLVIRLTRAQLRELADNKEDSFIHIHDFEGRGHPDFISLVINEDDTPE